MLVVSSSAAGGWGITLIAKGPCAMFWWGWGAALMPCDKEHEMVKTPCGISFCERGHPTPTDVFGKRLARKFLVVEINVHVLRCANGHVWIEHKARGGDMSFAHLQGTCEFLTGRIRMPLWP